MPWPELIVFDFDGVVADSEVGANAVLAQAITALGRPTTLEDCLARYMGRRWVDCAALIEADLGTALPEGFADACREGIAAHHAAALEPVPGVAAFLARLGDTPRCVASSSSPQWLAGGLERLGLAHRFGPHVFSAQQVERGKPAPDLFLLAAREMGVEPGRALVIEDSVPGVTAGRAAGMTTVGLCAGSHIRPGHAERLRAAGAHQVATSYDDLLAWLEVEASAPAMRTPERRSAGP